MVAVPTCAAVAFMLAPFAGWGQWCLPLFVVCVVTTLVPLLAWLWVVGTRMAVHVGGHATWGAALLRGALVGLLLSLGLIYAAGFWWTAMPEELLTFASVVGLASYLYAISFVGWVATRADLGTEWRIWHAVVAVVVLWAFAGLGAFLLQSRVNRVAARVSE
jgi:hypothetical protein